MFSSYVLSFFFKHNTIQEKKREKNFLFEVKCAAKKLVNCNMSLICNKIKMNLITMK